MQTYSIAQPWIATSWWPKPEPKPKSKPLPKSGYKVGKWPSIDSQRTLLNQTGLSPVASRDIGPDSGDGKGITLELGLQNLLKLELKLNPKLRQEAGYWRCLSRPKRIPRFWVGVAQIDQQTQDVCLRLGLPCLRFRVCTVMDESRWPQDGIQAGAQFLENFSQVFVTLYKTL